MNKITPDEAEKARKRIKQRENWQRDVTKRMR